jgi:hypothetical protein
LDAGIRNNAGDAQIVALLLADELVGNSHMTCTVRDIAEAYLTKGAVAGRAVLRQEAACLDVISHYWASSLRELTPTSRNWTPFCLRRPLSSHR